MANCSETCGHFVKYAESAVDVLSPSGAVCSVGKKLETDAATVLPTRFHGTLETRIADDGSTEIVNAKRVMQSPRILRFDKCNARRKRANTNTDSVSHHERIGSLRGSAPLSRPGQYRAPQSIN